jgi:7,8-dihydropterin-6-yl-methyl-4-(beta-D-ribofuranosyl)aminobenzene 5'-phosphate synthase
VCSSGDAAEAAGALPQDASRPVVDPIHLEPVDEVTITTLVDNVYDGLLPADERVSRAPMWVGRTSAGQFVGGDTIVGMLAEHGFAALVTVRRGDTSTTLLFDTGMSPGTMITNAERLGVDWDLVHGIVLSHGHSDHAGGLAGLARRRGRHGLPMTVHPYAWTPRRLTIQGADPVELPTLSKRALEDEGFAVVERRQPSLLVDNAVLITGEVDRTTEFERGMPPYHQAWTGSDWTHDPRVIDDQALVVHVRGRGLVVLTGCGHAGVINIVRHASRLTGVDRLHALLGGMHLSGPAFEPVIAPTVEALTALAPDLLVTGHCTGWRAQGVLAAALPHAWLPGSSGSTYRLTAA